MKPAPPVMKARIGGVYLLSRIVKWRLGFRAGGSQESERWLGHEKFSGHI
jgi:hypothetical protein